MIPLIGVFPTLGRQCVIHFGLSRMIHLIETSIFAVVYQSPWHPKNLGIEAIELRIFVLNSLMILTIHLRSYVI